MRTTPHHATPLPAVSLRRGPAGQFLSHQAALGDITYALLLALIVSGLVAAAYR